MFHFFFIILIRFIIALAEMYTFDVAIMSEDHMKVSYCVAWETLLNIMYHNGERNLKKNRYMYGLPRWRSGKETTCQGRRHKTLFWSLGWEDALEEEMATHSSILVWKNSMDRGAWRAAVLGSQKSLTRLSTDTRICVTASLCCAP